MTLSGPVGSTGHGLVTADALIACHMSATHALDACHMSATQALNACHMSATQAQKLQAACKTVMASPAV